MIYPSLVHADRKIRYSLLAIIVTLSVWATGHEIGRQSGMVIDQIGVLAGTARRPLVIVAGQTEQLPTADYLQSLGGISVNATPPTAPGDIEATTINGAPVSGTPNTYAGTFFLWTDDFLYQNTFSITGTSIGTLWDMTLTGANAGIAASGTTTRPGLINMATGTTTTGRATLTTSNTMTDFGSGTWDFATTVGWTVLDDGTDNYAAILGFADTQTGVDQVDGCYFLYDKQNVAVSGPNVGNTNTLSCWCVQNSTRTTFLMNGVIVSDGGFTTVNAPVAALVLPSTNIYRLEVSMVGNTEADFLVNGVKSCVITHNIPTGVNRLTGVEHVMLKSAGVNTRGMIMDQTQFSVALNVARSP